MTTCATGSKRWIGEAGRRRLSPYPAPSSSLPVGSPSPPPSSLPLSGMPPLRRASCSSETSPTARTRQSRRPRAPRSVRLGSAADSSGSRAGVSPPPPPSSYSPSPSVRHEDALPRDVRAHGRQRREGLRQGACRGRGRGAVGGVSSSSRVPAEKAPSRPARGRRITPPRVSPLDCCSPLLPSSPRADGRGPHQGQGDGCSQAGRRRRKADGACGEEGRLLLRGPVPASFRERVARSSSAHDWRRLRTRLCRVVTASGGARSL